MRFLRQTLSCFLLLTVITGIFYPLAVTGIAHFIFPDQATGSLLFRQGKPIGSALIGQSFTGPRYFWPRPSAMMPVPYQASASSGSNLGPLNPQLVLRLQATVGTLRQAHPHHSKPIPVDLLTASGSGLDPHISPAAAEFQIERVAQARQMDATQLRKLVKQFTECRQLGFFGEPRINVLLLNLALDESVKP